MQKGSDLAKVKGMDWSMLKSALIPEVSNLMQSVEKIKEVQRGVDKSLELIGVAKGVDKNKLRDEALLKAFYNVDENGNYTLKNATDISTIDPTFDYIDYALRNKDVYTPMAVTEFITTQQPTEIKVDEVTRDKAGKEVRKTFDVKAPEIYTPDVDASGKFTGEFVPKYELFTDKDVVKIHQFKGDKGDVNAPIRLAADPVYNAAINDPNLGGYIRQETRKFANQFGIQLDSPQAGYFSRALTYDLLKTNKPSTFLKEFQAVKQPEAPRQTVNVGGAGGQAPYNPIWPKFVARAKVLTTEPQIMRNGKKVPYSFVPINKLPGDVKNSVLKAYAASVGKKPEEVRVSDFLINVNEQGEWAMYTVKKGKQQFPEVGTLSEDELNTYAAQGAKERAGVYAEEVKYGPPDMPIIKKKNNPLGLDLK